MNREIFNTPFSIDIEQNHTNGLPLTELLINILETISQTIHQRIFLVDILQKNIIWASNTPLIPFQQSPQKIRNLAYTFYSQHIPIDEQKQLKNSYKAILNFFYDLPINERKDYSCSFDFHFIIQKQKVLVKQTLAPILLARNGKVQMAVCFMSLSSHKTPGHTKIYKNQTTDYWEFSFSRNRWKKHESITLNNREKHILLLSAQGYTTSQIADKLCLAIDTIKFHKRKIYEKLKVKNISEAILYAQNHKLL